MPGPRFDRHALRAARDDANLTREKLSVAADVPYGTLQRYENGHTADPNFNALARLAVVLGVSLDSLVIQP